jgi:hypothetical protein
MNGNSIRTDRCAIAGILYFVLATAICTSTQTARGKELPEPEVAIEAADSALPPRSVLEDSYGYHRFGTLPGNAPHPITSPAREGGWYHYGFPRQPHRWGWFGAEHYYPRVLWHRGYYGDHYRLCYRRGY